MSPLILIIFGTQNREETLHRQFINYSTSPVKCSHCTLRNSKSHFQQ